MFSFSSTVIFSIFLEVGIAVGFWGIVGFELTLLRVSILVFADVVIIMSSKAQRSRRRGMA